LPNNAKSTGWVYGSVEKLSKGCSI